MPTKSSSGDDSNDDSRRESLLFPQNESQSQQSNGHYKGGMVTDMNSQTREDSQGGSDKAALEQSVSSQASAATNKKKITPNPDDILMGRGWPYQRYSGNLKFRRFLKDYKERYNSAPRSDRRQVVMEVLRTLKQKGCRFLISKNGRGISSGSFSLSDVEWKIASKGEAYEKVSHTLRGKSCEENTSQSTSDGNMSGSSVGAPLHQVDSRHLTHPMNRQVVNHPSTRGNTNVSNQSRTTNENRPTSLFIAATSQQSDVMGSLGNSLHSSSSNQQPVARFSTEFHTPNFDSHDRANAAGYTADHVLSSSNVVPDTGSTMSSGRIISEDVGVSDMGDDAVRTITISMAIREYLNGNSGL